MWGHKDEKLNRASAEITQLKLKLEDTQKKMREQGENLLKWMDSHDRLEEKYNELLMSVGTKYPNETRHQTALRYIREAERHSDTEAGQSKKDG